MTTAIKPMTEEAFDEYVANSVPNYAREKVASGEWQEEASLERAREVFQEMLPEGLETPDNYLFEVIDEWNDTPVGVLWFAIRERAGQKTAYICDVYIDPEQQSKGHASRALRALEDKVRSMGLTGIGLQVFGHNDSAFRLYKRLGYLPVNFFMFKTLDLQG
jgi:ribosomal protein S18 acetylase RimI-like enzyme